MTEEEPEKRLKLDVEVRLYDVDGECIDRTNIEDAGAVETEVAAVVAQGGTSIGYDVTDVDVVEVTEDEEE